MKFIYEEHTGNKNQNDVAMYIRVNKIHQLDYFVKEKISNNIQNKVVGLYMRTNATDDIEIDNSIYKQTRILEQYCKENNIINRIEYVDISKSGLSKDRKALQQMINDIKSKKINTIIVTDVTKLFRNPMDIGKLLLENYMKDIEIISLDYSLEGFKSLFETLNKNKHIEENTEDDDLEEI